MLGFSIPKLFPGLPITKTIKVRRTRDAGHSWRSRDELISDVPPHMAEQKQDDQLEHTSSSCVRIQDVALKTCQRRWTIGRNGEWRSGISVLAACHDYEWWWWWWWLYQSPLTSFPYFPESVFVELMELATKSVSFSFNGTRYFDGWSLRPYSCKYFLLGSMKNYFLKGFPSFVFIYVTWTILSLVFVPVMKLCHSSNGWIIYILL